MFLLFMKTVVSQLSLKKEIMIWWREKNLYK